MAKKKTRIILKKGTSFYNFCSVSENENTVVFSHKCMPRLHFTIPKEKMHIHETREKYNQHLFFFSAILQNSQKFILDKASGNVMFEGKVFNTDKGIGFPSLIVYDELFEGLKTIEKKKIKENDVVIPYNTSQLNLFFTTNPVEGTELLKNNLATLKDGRTIKLYIKKII